MMRSSTVLLWMLVVSFAAYSADRRYPLPPSAKIQIGGPVNRAEPGSTDSQADCSHYRLNAAHIRRMFATYHVVEGAEWHYGYDVYPCDVSGKIVIKGRTFVWNSNEGNVITTDYPDGVSKFLGGKRTGDVND